MSKIASSLSIRISLGFCLFLSLSPFLGRILEKILTYEIIMFFPYMHLGISNTAGMPFTESFGSLLAMFILLIGSVGIIRFYRKRKITLLEILLYVTIAYCFFKMLVGGTYLFFSDKHTTILEISSIGSNLFWIVVCFFTIYVLEKESRYVNF